MTEVEEKELKEIMTSLEEFAIKYDYKHISGCVIIEENELWSNCFEVGEFDIDNKRKFVREVKKQAKVGEYIKLVNNGNYSFNETGDILKVDKADFRLVSVHSKNHPRDTGIRDIFWTYWDSSYVVLEGYEPPKKFEPYLSSCFGNDSYGIIGTETKMKDIRGEKLYVGDVVTVIAEHSENCGKFFVVEKNNYCFVMGLAGSCKQNGNIEGGYIIIKEKSFKELSDKENFNCITAILKEHE